MLLYGVCDCWHDVVHIAAVSYSRLDGLMSQLGRTCHETEFPFCFSLSSKKVTWYHPFDEIYIDFEEINYTDSFGDVHFCRDECFLNEDHYRQLFIDEFYVFFHCQLRTFTNLH